MLLVWDFTDTSYRHSIELKATSPAEITSMEFLLSNKMSKQQLLAAGDNTGSVHIFEMPVNLVNTLHKKEEEVMRKFLDREDEVRIFF
jgi:hypothetical protein